ETRPTAAVNEALLHSRFPFYEIFFVLFVFRSGCFCRRRCGQSCIKRSNSIETYHDLQAAGLSVAATDGPAAGFDACPHDGQAKTDSASLARARIVHPKEWIEQSRQKLLGYSGTAVGHLDHDSFRHGHCTLSERTGRS